MIGAYSCKFAGEYDPSKNEWLVIKPFTFTPDGCISYYVPAGWYTDLASTRMLPPVIAKLFPPDGPWLQAAVLHDYLYGAALYNKKYCDTVFEQALRAIQEVPHWKIPFMVCSVRAFAGPAYRNNKIERIRELRALGGFSGDKMPLFW